MEHIDGAVVTDGIAQMGFIAGSDAIDENDNVLPQMTLVVENIAAQPRIYDKSIIERIP